MHAYVLMTNHVHLLVSADKAGSAGSLMKALGQRYVQYVNRAYRRSGFMQGNNRGQTTIFNGSLRGLRRLGVSAASQACGTGV